MPTKPINLLLGADSLLGMRSGVGRMTLEIAREISRRSDIAEFGFLVEGGIRPRQWLGSISDNETAKQSKVKAIRRLGKSLLGQIPGVRPLRSTIRRAQLNNATRRLSGQLMPVLYHEPNMITAPYDGPTVATFNDLSWHWDKAIHPPERIRWIYANLPRVLSESTRFIAISDFTAQDLVREFNVPRNLIDVVPLAPAAAFKPIRAAAAAPTLARYGLHDQNYIFSVSTLEPRKNFDRLLTAYLDLPAAVRAKAPLVIAGGKGWGDVLHKADRAIAAGELRLLGHIADDDLATLTARCGVFAYVSLYEGFGLPIVEAMATGAPVIASCTTATGETAGNGALLVNPMDEAEIRASLLAMLEDRELREKWQQAGLRRSATFSWRLTVDCLMTGWHTALGYEEAVRQPSLSPVLVSS